MITNSYEAHAPPYICGPATHGATKRTARRNVLAPPPSALDLAMPGPGGRRVWASACVEVVTGHCWVHVVLKNRHGLSNC